MNITLDKKDSYLKDYQKNSNYHYHNEKPKKEKILFTYSPIKDISEQRNYWSRQDYPEKENDSYHKLFKAT